jgi:hypothetical protein
MQRWRFAQIAAVAALGLGAWIVGRLNDDSVTAGAAVASEPLFSRFVVAPGDDPSVLPVAIGGAQLIEIDRTGALLVHIGPRVRRQHQPRAYQDIDGRRHDVTVRFDIAATGDPRLVVGPYDRTSPLVIDAQPGKDDLQP